MNLSRMNRAQKQKLIQFQTVTGANDRVALECLKQSGWVVEGAIDIFFTSPAACLSIPAANQNAIQQLYLKYKDPHEDCILAEGVSQLCDDLQVDPEDVVMLVLSWHLKAEAMCEFTRDEFVNGLAALGCDSLQKLQQKLPELRAELNDPGRFREVYNYAYLFSREKGQKCVQLDTALAMWQLVLRDRWPLLDQWCEFLKHNHSCAISKDTWSQLLDFIQSVKPDLSNFDENGAWPYLIDEFVEHMQQQQQAGS